MGRGGAAMTVEVWRGAVGAQPGVQTRPWGRGQGSRRRGQGRGSTAKGHRGVAKAVGALLGAVGVRPWALGV